MSSKLNFDATKVAPQQPMEPVPAGWYPVVISKSGIEPTKDTKGSRLALEYEIIDGEFKGRRIFDGLNIKNNNPVAQDIAQRQLSAICHATGVMQVTDTSQLHGKPFLVRVALDAARVDEKDGKSYEARNQVKAFKPMEGASAPVAQSPANAPAWAKKTAEASAPAAKAPPGKPKPAPKASAPAKDERLFWVAVDPDADSEERTGEQIKEMLAAGMPPDTQVTLQDTEEWKTASEFFGETSAAEEPAPAAAPAKAPPAKPAPAAKPAGNRPPWAK